MISNACFFLCGKMYPGVFQLFLVFKRLALGFGIKNMHYARKGTSWGERMITIENSLLKVDINELGAEVTHIIQKEENFDFIWNGTAWKRHAPILFPSIGRSNEDQYSLEGKLYPMSQHGFARDYPWTVVDKGDDRVRLTLTQNEETLVKFPFDFELSVSYELKENSLKTTFEVKNNTDRKMPFALGSHPGFNVPINGDQLAFEDYKITISPEVTQLQQFEINPAPFRTGKVVDLKAATGSVLPLDHKTFDDGLIVIANQGLTSIKLSSDKSEHSIELTLEDFPYVTLWTMENEKAPFLCVEPFNGLPDVKGPITDWFEKEGNVTLDGQSTGTYSYEMHLK